MLLEYSINITQDNTMDKDSNGSHRKEKFRICRVGINTYKLFTRSRTTTMEILAREISTYFLSISYAEIVLNIKWKE